MPSTLAELEAEALHLPVEQRAQLAERLLASLDEVGEAEAERLWADEAERRFQEYRQGKISSRPAADVMRDARRRIQ